MRVNRFCSICGEPFEELRPGNRVYYCPECYKDYKQAWWESKKKKEKAPINMPDYKECSCCGKELAASEFGRDSSKKTGLTSKCKKCRRT